MIRSVYVEDHRHFVRLKRVSERGRGINASILWTDAMFVIFVFSFSAHREYQLDYLRITFNSRYHTFYN